MAGRKKKPFVKKPNVGRPFDKQGKLADLVRTLSGKKMPFDKAAKMRDGGEAKKKMTVPTPKPKGSEMNEILAMREQRKLNPYSDEDRERIRKQPVGKKDGGEVCRGGRSAERGTQFRGVR